MKVAGREKIFTNVREITEKNIIQVLQDAVVKHNNVASECDFLIGYENGLQPIDRVKEYRPDIDCKCVDNVANEVVEFKLGFNWGNPITLIQRGEKDSGDPKEADAIALLNECYSAENIGRKTQELAYFIETTGIGYVYVDINTEYEEGDSYFKIETLDPRTSFVVYSATHMDHRPLLGVTFRKDDLGNRYFTCFTKNRRYEVNNTFKVVNGEIVDKSDKWGFSDRSGEANPLGIIPIVEYIRSVDRTGCFERQISEMNNLNLLVSDLSNQTEQNTQSIWHGNDIAFPIDENGNEVQPTSNDWILTETSPDGNKPFIKPLSVDYDYKGTIDNISYRRTLILQKCNVPIRNDNTNGATGVAMSDATGWSSAEAAACKEQAITESCKMQEIKVVLRAIKKSSDVKPGNPLLELKYNDIMPSIKRQKSYEMTSKVNALATMLAHGVHGLHAFKSINFFDDVQQAWEDSKPLVERYQDSVFDKKNSAENTNNVVENEENVNSFRLSGDNSDQIGNSPNIEGSTKESV